ncbi:MAG TPA: hypothetical protein VFK02_29955 [Kofleriaceae bacterium]|nr:hypothetical protein [Kofleriaceae bacterium]
MRVATVLVLVGPVALGTLAGCGNKPPAPPPDPRDARIADAELATAADLEARPLGLPELAAYRWRKRAGQAAFRLARKAEDRDDWASVVETCRQVLAADPGHLDAAWLLAVGYAKLGQTDRVLAPLAQAVAGDFGKWGPASLELPALRGFLATPTGEAWRRRVDQDRARYVAAIARGLLVTADGDLYAVETSAGRWHRLTRTPGNVIGALAIPAASRIAYVSRTRQSGKHELGIGVIDLARGKSSRPVPLGTAGPITIAYSAKPPVGFWIGSGAPRPLAWRQIDDDYHVHALPARTARPSGPWLDVTAKGTVRLHALPSGITADWDDQSLASAIRIGTSNRVVSVPSPGLIDGNTAAWSPDHVNLAFVAQLDDHCAPGAVNTAAFIADASTGGTRELERAARGIALVWLADRTLAIAGDHGVAIRSLDDAVPAVTVEGATGLLIPRERPRCAPVEAADEPGSDEADLQEPAEPAAGDEPPDAGVGDRR